MTTILSGAAAVAAPACDNRATAPRMASDARRLAPPSDQSRRRTTSTTNSTIGRASGTAAAGRVWLDERARSRQDPRANPRRRTLGMSKQFLRRDDDIPAFGPCPLDEPRRFLRVPRAASAPQHHRARRQAQDEPEPAPPGSHADRGDDGSDPGRGQHTRDPRAPRHRRERPFNAPPSSIAETVASPRLRGIGALLVGRVGAPIFRPRSSGCEPPIQPREARAQAPSTNGCRTGRPERHVSAATGADCRDQPASSAAVILWISASGRATLPCRATNAARTTAADSSADGGRLDVEHEVRSCGRRANDRTRFGIAAEHVPRGSGAIRTPLAATWRTPNGGCRMRWRCTARRDPDRSASGGSFPASRSRRSGARRSPLAPPANRIDIGWSGDGAGAPAAATVRSSAGRPTSSASREISRSPSRDRDPGTTLTAVALPDNRIVRLSRRAGSIRRAAARR